MIQFEDPRDAEDAIHGRDGYNFDGNRLRVGAVSCVCSSSHFTCLILAMHRSNLHMAGGLTLHPNRTAMVEEEDAVVVSPGIQSIVVGQSI